MLNIQDQVFRMKLSSLTSFIIAFAKLLFSLMTFSIFIGINAFYTATIGYGKHQSALGLSLNKQNEKKYYRKIGLLIFIANLAYLLYASRLFFITEQTSFDQNAALGIATITFFELGLNIAGIIKANKKKDILLQAAKLLNLSSALIGLVLTQAALLSYTRSAGQEMANITSALLFSTVNISMSIWMLVRKLPDTTTEST